ncbi:MAG: invasion associated locus B family protein [Pseudomonadota bacterium]
MALGLASPSLAQNPPQEVLRATHGDWEVRCIDGTDVCAMSQLGSTEAGERALLVTVQRISGVTADNGITIPGAMTVQAPLGILLPYGIRLKIDADPVVPLPLNRCLPAGCISQAPMQEEAVAKMKAGSTAVFGFFLDQEIIVNISLRGFTKAYNSLTPVNANNQ